MAAIPAEPTSPVIANLVVLAGFVAIFSTFVTDSPFSWIVGAIMVVAGGIWAGFVGNETVDEAVVPDTAGTHVDASEGQTNGGAA